MCGTPLPQRPIIAPGAQSTADLTRHPLDISQSAASRATNFSSLSSPSATEATEPQSSVATGPNYFSQAEEAESLEQFIAGFHYTPPAEEQEVTMTGAKAELDDTASYQPAAPVSMAEESSVPVAETLPSADQPLAVNAEPLPPQVLHTEIIPSEETPLEQPPLITTEPPPFAMKGAKNEEPERSRFLEFSAPAQEVEPANELAPPQEEEPAREAAPVSTSIGGPSFLGLSDTPASMAYVAEDGNAPRSHWRGWTALILIAIFAILGLLEWRAEKNQSSNGPIGIMKMQIDRLKGSKGVVVTPPPSSQAAGEATSASSPNPSGPQMQIAPHPRPQTVNPQPANPPEPPPANRGAASNQPPAASPVAKVQPSPPQAGSAANAPKPQTPPAKAESTKTESPAAQSAETEKPAKPTVPGAEELAKAANASDAAAASAWLWKSVAKGNPEAPIKLANMYIKGEGVAQSCDQAMVLLRSAAAKENAGARSRLGTLYATGTCVPRNRVRAYQYMSEALEANPNATWARDFRQQLWTQMTPEERQRAQKAP